MATQRWMITGGAGFIGSALVRQLIAETTSEVVNVDVLTYAGSLSSLGDAASDARHHFARVNIADASAVRALLHTYRPQVVVHLAAETHVDRSIDGPAAFLQTNVIGTYTLLDEARRYWQMLSAEEAAAFRLLHVSTDEVFGDATNAPAFNEATAYDPSSPYAASKAAADHLVRAWHRTYGLPALVTNCSNNYGPCQFPEKLIPLTIGKALRGEPIPVYGDGQQVRDWLHVDDHARALRVVATHGVCGATYAVGARTERRNLSVVQEICRIMDQLRPRPGGLHESLISFVADRPGHDRRYAIDPSRIERDLPWKPMHRFEDGLRATVQWYLDHQAWVESMTRGAYRGERLGLGATA